MQTALEIVPTATLSFTVNGRAQTQGSKRAIPFKRHDGSLGVNVIEGDDEAAKERKKTWRSDVREAARAAMGAEGWRMTAGPVEVALTFIRKRPQAHVGVHGVKERYLATRPTTAPDTIKLTRAVEDAMTGLVYRDDAQIVEHKLSKVFGDQVGLDPYAEGVTITITTL